MRYWWVNQNQTYRHEVQGGYLWSPKRNANGARNPFYESMREVAPGDLIFSFIDTRILAVGIAQSYCWERIEAAGARVVRARDLGARTILFACECRHVDAPAELADERRIEAGETRDLFSDAGKRLGIALAAQEIGEVGARRIGFHI